MTASGPSIQPHIQRARVEFERFVKQHALLPDHPDIGLTAGLVSIRLARPLMYQEMRELSYLFAADPDLLREAHEASEASRRAAYEAARGEEESDEDYVEPEARTKISEFGLLAKTTKMGAYSFNLPAGPTGAESLGTCPISALHWPLAKHQASVATNGLLPAPGAANDWICASCYAMKGAYGAPSSILIQSLRRRFVMSLAPDSHALATVLTQAIRWAQVKSIRSQRALSGKLDKKGHDRALSVPDPQFFRIHDAGDFGIGPWYVAAWLETCRRCAEPHAVRLPRTKLGDLDLSIIETAGTARGEDLLLPGVRFWAATRAWPVWSGLEEYAKHGCGCVPANLTIRPSALYFGDAAPALNGQTIRLPAAEGEPSQSVTVGNYAPGTTAETLDKASSLGGHVCPAYIPADPGHPKSAPGACHKSRGTHADTDPRDLPAPAGYGCRACWLSNEPVTYVRH